MNLYDVEKRAGGAKAQKNIERYLDELDNEIRNIKEIQEFLRQAHSAISTNNIEFGMTDTEVVLSINSPHYSTDNNITVDIKGAEKVISFRDIKLRKNEFNNEMKFIVSPVLMSDDVLTEQALITVTHSEDKGGK